jgi:hypothetical protein
MWKVQRTTERESQNHMLVRLSPSFGASGAMQHQKTKGAFCMCGKYKELNRMGVSKVYALGSRVSGTSRGQIY